MSMKKITASAKNAAIRAAKAAKDAAGKPQTYATVLFLAIVLALAVLNAHLVPEAVTSYLNGGGEEEETNPVKGIVSTITSKLSSDDFYAKNSFV